ncbi:MAG: GDP-mannose 4,6-dehydratase [Candidatus Parvarchaeota archaeon]
MTSACIKAAEIVDIGEYNVGTGKRYTIDQVANLIFQNIGWKPKNIYYSNRRPTGVYSSALDITKARRELGWEPRYTLEEGLKNTIEWYRVHGDLVGISEKNYLKEAL